jgi:MauM/NapG family ferredoxin protein
MQMRWLRRGSQLLIFALFLFLFLQTEYQDNDVLPYAVNIFLRLDPLVAAAAALAAHTLIALVWPALITIGLTLLFGRFFCGWVCPMGALLDFTSWLLGKRRSPRRLPPRLKQLKFLLLFALAASALFTLQLVYLFDPISLLIRSLAVAVYPALNVMANALFGALYNTNSGAVTTVSEPVYTFLKAHFLAFEQPHFQSALVVGLLFVGILALEAIERRFWCRYLCPLGAFFGLMARIPLIRRKVSEPDCTSCSLCARSCRMAAVGEGYLATDRAECIACFDCEALCPERAIHFGVAGGAGAANPDLTRRGLLIACGLGALAVPLFGAEATEKQGNPARIRPPGALPEKEFLARCTRCGECMRVCIANGLQPALFEAGAAGLWSPVLVPRIGYCEYNCTLCGQVCPTGAISRLDLPKKQNAKIGLADIDRSRCLPWNGNSECIVCEEHCPTPVKAIRLREEEVYSVNSGAKITVQRPYVDEKLCIGCGICETKCPLSDRAAIIVSCRGESRAEGNLH